MNGKSIIINSKLKKWVIGCMMLCLLVQITPAVYADESVENKRGLNIRKTAESIEISLERQTIRASLQWLRTQSLMNLKVDELDGGNWIGKQYQILVYSTEGNRLRATVRDAQTAKQYRIDSGRIRASLFVIPAAVVIGQLLLIELLAVSAAIVIAGVTYTLATEIAALLRNKPNKYYAAYLDVKQGVYIGNPISFHLAVNRLKSSSKASNNVWSVSRAEAYAVAQKAGSMRTPIYDAAHGPYPKYLPHYHRFDRKGGHSFF